MAATVKQPLHTLLLVLCVGLELSWPATAEKELGGGWKEKTNNEGKVVQELKIEAPSFTEEDQYGYVMPDRYRCDSCRAVIFHLDQGLRKKQPKSRRLKQWEFTDIFEEICGSGFEGYGIRLVNGQNALSGPGLSENQEQLNPGSGAIQMGGENWSKRLGEICRRIVFEKVGEDEVYERFWQRFSVEGSPASDVTTAGLRDEICTKELKECRIGPLPPPSPKEEKKKEKPKAKKEAKETGSKAKAKPDKKAPGAAKGTADSSMAASPAAGERIGAEAFLRDLAVRQGFTPEEYLAARTVGEWERLSLAIASRLFNSASNSVGGSQSCPSAGTGT